MGVSFPDFGFLTGFLENVMAVCCLFSSHVQLVCSQGMPAGLGGFATGMNWGKKSRRRRCL